MFESILKSTDSTISASGSLISILGAIVLGLIISMCYMYTQKKGTYTKDFAITIAILPAIVSIVIMLVGSNIARAFSLAGAFSLVRFRSVEGKSKDIAIVFFVMAIGLAAGLGFILFGAVTTVIICIMFFILSKTPYGEKQSEEQLLKVTVHDNLNYKQILGEIFDIYLKHYDIKFIKTTHRGTLYELQYIVVLKEDTDEKEFIDAIKAKNDNLNISLGSYPDRDTAML